MTEEQRSKPWLYAEKILVLRQLAAYTDEQVRQARVDGNGPTMQVAVMLAQFLLDLDQRLQALESASVWVDGLPAPPNNLDEWRKTRCKIKSGCLLVDGHESGHAPVIE